MAGAQPEPGLVGGGASTLPGRSHSAVRVAPLDPEQLRRVLEQVTRAQPPPPALQDARRLRVAAQQAAPQRGPGAEAPRLLLPQQLEAICVKVMSGDTKSKERPMPPLAVIRPKTARQSQLPGRSSSRGLGVSSPQLLRVQALGRTGSQLHFLGGSPQPPAPQVFVQKPLPALQPVPLKRVKTHQTANGHGTTLSPLAACSPCVVAPVSSASARLCISSLHTAQTEKLKKSLKVKTRSGRISRPPKYKARDYKFIKTEDLADGHLSDSDDYSELSVEEEDEQREKPVLFDIEGCALKPKAFKCQTCEKSYIGKGGLARHLKLNPGHSQLEPEVLLSKKANGSLTPGCTDSKTRGLASPKPSTPAAVCMEEAEAAWRTPQNGQSMNVEETQIPEPENRSPSAYLRPKKDLEPKDGKWERQAEFSTASLQESGVVQPNSDPAVPSGLSVSSRTQLQEVARSLGITEFLRKKETHWSSASKCSSHEREGKLEEASGQKRERDLGVVATAEGLLIGKKPRTAALPTDVPECPNISGCQQKPGPSCAPANDKGSAPAAIEKPSHCSGGICGDMVPSSGGHVPLAGQQLTVMMTHDFEARCGSADPAPLCQGVSRSALYSQVAEPRGLPPAQKSAFSEENASARTVDQDSGIIQRSSRVGGTASSGGKVESPFRGESGNAEAGDLRETSQPHLSGQQASPSHVLLVKTAAFPLQNTLPTACVSKTMPESPRSAPDGSLSTNGGSSVGSEAGDISQVLSRMETRGQRGPETMAAVGKALAFENSDICQEVLSQGQEQIFIQTSNGLLLSHPSTTVSQEEDDIIVTNAGGSMVKFGQ
ncbi:zinc finger protein 839 isoform X3 [Meriones unguiculatus]|uniref:zinc finger protein 839 isoform X3 n=1 Tax=Meriones unguiculatus TaxID=10047 RepID=UPI00293EE2EE|nr:zinc finger protein 839 isoform X3 [Meriones unguiculatus]